MADARRKARIQLGHHIRELRRQRKLTQVELAKRAGLSGRRISDVERGGNPTLAALLAIAEGLGVEPAQLFAGVPLHIEEGRRFLTSTEYHQVMTAVQTLSRTFMARTRRASK